ncbi:MAG: peptide MFS transporter [Gammaproteobacteria bacterium]|nr:peptide MFS transporter [Gammaproteobacteria bacterium]
MNTPLTEAQHSLSGPNILGHPRMLWMLLAATVGINFAFYGFRAFLAPYVAEAFFAGLPQSEALTQANLLFAGFGALLYAATIVGGWVADNVLGEVQALRLSLWLTIVGLVCMALPGREAFLLALAFYILSAGLNIPLTVLVGRNYLKADPRRDAGYTLFYMAINLGSFVAPFVCAAWVGVHYGFRWGFIPAAVVALAAALIFEWKHRRVPTSGEPVRFQGRWSTPVVVLVTLLLSWPCMLLLAHPAVLTGVVYALMALLVLYFILSSLRRGERVQSHRYLAMLLLFIALVLFWAWSLQSASSLNFFARDYVDAPFNFTWYQSANPLYILIFAIPISILWPWLEKRGINPSTPRKFGIGLLLVALSYGVLLCATRFLVMGDGHISWWPLMVWYLLSSLGELALSPIGYAMIGKLAAPNEASLAMGGWFFGVSVAYDLSGQIAAMTTRGGLAGYSHVFELLLWVGVGIAIVYLLAASWIVKLMHGVR